VLKTEVTVHPVDSIESVLEKSEGRVKVGPAFVFVASGLKIYRGAQKVQGEDLLATRLSPPPLPC